MAVMGDHIGRWPRRYADADAAARALAYLMAVVAALGVAFGPLDVIGQTSHIGVDALAWLVAIAGAVGFTGTVFRRWMIELVATYVLAVALTVYTIADWAALVFIVGFPPLPVVAVAIGGGFAAMAAVATGQHRWRWAAILAGAAVVSVTLPMGPRNPAVITLATALIVSRAIGLTVFRLSTVDAQYQARQVHDTGQAGP